MSILFQTIQIGNFHPLLVHLPIGIILMAFALEMFSRYRRKRSGDELILFTLGCAGIAALLSLGTGWLLGEEGGLDEDLLFLHRWMAVAFTITTIILFFLKRSKSAISDKLYIPTFVIVLVLISITGHYGGTMTHGEDYLFKDSDSNKTAIKDIAEARVHADIIQPILDAKCISCHNQSKIKGGLLMATPSDLMSGGDSGSPFDSLNGNPLLIHRINLPSEDEEHMPPKGKIQLTNEEISLVEWWIANDHCFDCKTKDLETSKNLDVILASLEEDDSSYALIAKEVEAVPLTWLEKLNATGITIYPLAEDNPLLIVNLFGEQKHLEEKLKALDDYAENIVELNLGSSQFNDTIADLIDPFENLIKLQVQNTGLTDKSITILENFRYLESLNLYGTNISNQIFEIVQKTPNLKSLYLFETQVTNAEVEKFQIDFPAISIQHVPKDAFKANSLSAPAILAETTFFKGSLEIVMENIFEGAQIFYTLDGSKPDSTSVLYNEPLKITTSATVKAIARKKGWKPSDISTKSYKTTSVEFIDVALNKAPNEKYNGQQGKNLIDLKRGTENFVDGQWLGYEGSHFTTTLTLKEDKEISTVSVGALSAPGSWIFYPTGLTVYTSMNGKQFKRVKRKILPTEEPNTNVKIAFFDVEIPPTKAKYIKIEVKSQLKNPSWHPNPGGKSWVFIDEIVLN